MEENDSGTTSVKKIVSKIEKQISISDVSEDLSMDRNKNKATNNKTEEKKNKENSLTKNGKGQVKLNNQTSKSSPKSSPVQRKGKKKVIENKTKVKRKGEDSLPKNDKDQIQVDLQTSQPSSKSCPVQRKDKNIAIENEAELKIGEVSHSNNDEDQIQVEQQTSQHLLKSNPVQGNESSTEIRKNHDTEVYQETAMESKVDVEIEKESNLPINDSDIKVNPQTGQTSPKTNLTGDNNSSPDFSEDLDVEEIQTNNKMHSTDKEMVNIEVASKNDDNVKNVDQQTVQLASKSNLKKENDYFADNKTDLKVQKESTITKNNMDIQIVQRIKQTSTSNPANVDSSSLNFNEDLNVVENQTKAMIYNANVEKENVELNPKNDGNIIQVDQETAHLALKSNLTQEKDSSADISKNLNTEENKIKPEKKNFVNENYNNIQVNQQTAQSSSKSHPVQDKYGTDENVLDSSTSNEAYKSNDDIDSSRITSLDNQCETREQQINSKTKHQELLPLYTKMTNNKNIWYILLAVALGIFVYHHISTELDSKQLKIQLDIAHKSMEDLNKKIRYLEAENRIANNKLDDSLAKTSNNTFNLEVIRITNERDTLEIKLHEALNQIKQLQTKLDHALSEKNYLQAHAKEGNLFVNKESNESKEEDDSIDWLSTMQSFMGYVFNLPVYILFSFQITFLNLTCSVLLRDKLCSKLLKTPAMSLRHDDPGKFLKLYFFSCILGYPIACELVGLLGWFTGFSISKSSMLDLPKPIGLMGRSGEEILSDWITQDNALIIWLVSIIAGGIITFIQYIWYRKLEKRLKTEQFTKHQILLSSICTLIFLNLSLYRIFSWVTWSSIGVTIGPITFINWLGARKAVSKILSLVIYSILPLFTLHFLHKKSPSLVRNIFTMFKNLLFKSK